MVRKGDNGVIFAVHRVAAQDTLCTIAKDCGGLPEDIRMMNTVDRAEESKYRKFHAAEDMRLLPTYDNRVSVGHCMNHCRQKH